MVVVKSFKVLFLIGIFTTISIFSVAYANSPIVVEIFGKNGCDADTKAQDKLFEIMQKDSNIILINCRKYYNEDNEDNRYTLGFCNERARKYNTKFGYAGVKTPMIVINGKLDAFRKNLKPAINFGKTDKLYKIKLSRHGQSINIEIPEIDSDNKHASIFLYAYLPTQGKKTYIADPDLEITEDVKEKLRKNKKVPFVQKVHLKNFYLRPVIKHEKIGTWTGEKMSLTYPLHDIIAMAGKRAKDLSYIVVIQTGNGYGPIIAAGEIISKQEMIESLPKNEPLEIRFMSRPTMAAPTIPIQ